MVTRETNFAARVRTEMRSQSLSIRGLARRIDPANIDRVRRNLHRWLDEGTEPHDGSRREVALALGLDEHALDDEEDDLPYQLMERAMRLIARQELQKAGVA